jgi:zinc transport system permease protein
MGDFFSALSSPGMSFLLYALLIGIIGSVAFGVTGAYVVTRRISSLAGAVAHCVLGGIGAALFLRAKLHWSWCHPILGATIAALLAAIIIGLVHLKAKQREDTVIGAIWAIGMATGLLFIACTPGYVNLESYLFGNILLVSKTEFIITLALDIIVVTLSVLFYNNFVAVCFDSRFAWLRGVNSDFYYLLLLCIVSLTVVLMVNVVGIIMVIALLTLPAATAGRFTGRLWTMMILASILSMFFSVSGLILSYKLNLPSGPVIVMIAGLIYVISLFIKKKRIR